MIDEAILAAALVFLLAITASVDRSGSRLGGRRWATAWGLLYIGALVNSLGEGAVWTTAVSRSFATLFGAYLLAGAREFAGVPVPRWLLPAALAVGALRVVAEPFASPVTANGVGVVLLSGFALASSWTVLERPGARLWDRVLAGGMLALPLAGSFFAYANLSGSHQESALLFWVLVGIFVGGSQVCALLSLLAGRSAEQSSTLTALLDSVPIGLALSDPEGRVHTMNARFAEQLRLGDPARQIGRPFEEVADQLARLVEPDLARGVLAWRSRLDSLPVSGEDEVRFLDGRVALGATRAVTNAGGKHVGRLWYLNDVTEERRLDRELNAARRLEVLGGLAGGVAHDFNNKLTTILGNVSMLRDSRKPGDADEEILADLETAAEYCAELTKDLLTFARRTPRSLVRIEPASFVETLADPLRGTLPERIALRIDVAESCPAIEADPVQLERSLWNLVTNARDAIPARGTITLSAGPDGGDASRVQIVVADEGLGMDADTQERIFDPFYTTKPVGEGTGLGLPIVLGIVTAHGGEVSVESARGGGTRIRTTWPLATAATRSARSDESQSSASKGPSGSELVLVVDDEAPVRRFVRATLEGAGFRVLEASGGAAALELFEANRDELALALVDLAMPGMSGTQLIDRMRHGRPELAAVLMSGNLELERGASPDLQRLSKPYRSAALLRCARQAIDSAKQDAGRLP